MPFLSLPFHRLRYEDTGGHKPALVFCHSFGMRAEMFAPQLRHFAATHRCIVWDQRAHGESAAEHPFGFWDSARDLIALLDHLGIDRAAVAGTSQGGFVALRAALLAPSRIASVAVFGSSIDAESEATREAYRALVAEVQASSFEAPPLQAIEAMAHVCFGPDFDAGAWKRSWQSWNPVQWQLAFDALAGRDAIAPLVGALRMPVLVMHGTRDNAYPIEVGRRIAAAIAQARYIEVEGGQHFLSITDPDVVNRTLAAFLAEHAQRVPERLQSASTVS